MNSRESWPDDIACRQTEWLIDQLFPGNPRLACGKSMHEISARSREDWRGHLAQQQFIVPNTLRPRRFLVCAFDDGEATQQASMLKSLIELAPLVCVVHSGISSLEGWFFVQSLPIRSGCVHSLVTPQVWGRIQPTGHARSRCACLAV